VIYQDIHTQMITKQPPSGHAATIDPHEVRLSY
jgi:hypothetical protein